MVLVVAGLRWCLLGCRGGRDLPEGRAHNPLCDLRALCGEVTTLREATAPRAGGGLLELAVTEFGDGPPVVVLHGPFGSARNWTATARRLASSHRVYVPDLRTHAASPCPPPLDSPPPG